MGLRLECTSQFFDGPHPNCEKVTGRERFEMRIVRHNGVGTSSECGIDEHIVVRILFDQVPSVRDAHTTNVRPQQKCSKDILGNLRFRLSCDHRFVFLQEKSRHTEPEFPI